MSNIMTFPPLYSVFVARDYRPKVEANEFSQHYLIKFQVTVCKIACLQSNSFDFLPVNFQLSFNTKICMKSVQPTLGYIVTLTQKNFVLTKMLPMLHLIIWTKCTNNWEGIIFEDLQRH